MVSEPVLRRLGDDELARVEAAELFNGSQYPAHRERCREGPRRPAGLDHPALRGEQRDGRHVRVGHLVVPVPRRPRGRAVGAARRARPRPGRAWRDVLGLERVARRGWPRRAQHRTPARAALAASANFIGGDWESASGADIRLRRPRDRRDDRDVSALGSGRGRPRGRRGEGRVRGLAPRACAGARSHPAALRPTAPARQGGADGPDEPRDGQGSGGGGW